MSTLAKAERKEMEESKDVFFSQASLFSKKVGNHLHVVSKPETHRKFMSLKP